MDAMAVTTPLLLMSDTPSDPVGLGVYLLAAVVFCIFAWLF